MARRRFTVGTQYVYKEQIYIVRELLVSERISVENLSFGGRVVMSQNELSEAWARGEIVFEVHGPQTRKLQDSPLATAYKIADFQRLPPKGRDEAWRRYQILLPILAHPRWERTREFIANHAASLKPSPKPDDSSTLTIKNPRKGKTIGQATSRSSIEQWLYAFIESGYDSSQPRSGGESLPQVRGLADAARQDNHVPPHSRERERLYFAAPDEQVRNAGRESGLPWTEAHMDFGAC